MAFFYINMIFSYCKSSLLISILAVFIYIIFRLVVTYKEYKKRNIIIGSVLAFIVLVGGVLVIISVATKGSFIPILNKIVSSLFEQRTIKTRTYIWDNIINSLNQGYWALGRGFGIHNYVLYPMNLVNGDDVCPSHSTYFAIMGAGGVISLIGYIILNIYYIYVFIRCFKIKKVTSIGLVFPYLAFTSYSFTEGVNYLILVFMFPLLVYYQALIKSTEPLAQ